MTKMFQRDIGDILKYIFCNSCFGMLVLYAVPVYVHFDTSVTRYLHFCFSA